MESQLAKNGELLKFLSPEEELLWTGRPNCLMLAREQFLPMHQVRFLLGVASLFLLVGLLILFRVGRYAQVMPIAGDLLAWLLVGAGIVLALIPFLSSTSIYLAATKQVYAITNQRLLIIDIELKKILHMCNANEINLKYDQVDSVFFAESTETIVKDGKRILRPIGFEHIEDAPSVVDLIRKTFH